MPNVVTELLTKEYEREFEGVDGMVLVSMAGLTVAESESLRGSMAEKGIKLLMVKNSLAKRVLEKKGYTFAEDVIAGNVAIAYGPGEAAIHAAKILMSPEAKKAGKLKVRAGVLDGAVLGEQDATALADVPDEDTLRAQLVGLIQGPARAIAGLLAALPGGMARVINAHAEQGEAGSESAPAPE